MLSIVSFDSKQNDLVASKQVEFPIGGENVEPAPQVNGSQDAPDSGSEDLIAERFFWSNQNSKIF